MDNLHPSLHHAGKNGPSRKKMGVFLIEKVYKELYEYANLCFCHVLRANTKDVFLSCT